jgi:protein SCO1/2
MRAMRRVGHGSEARLLRLLRLAAPLILGFALPTGVALSHSLDELQSELTEREGYVQFVDRPAPGFTLLDPKGATLSLADLRGDVVVLWFIYARCPDVCPLHSEAMAKAQAMVNQTPMRDLVRFVAVTTDPVNDGPDVLDGYGPDHGLDPTNFLFLTSGPDAPEATRTLAEAYGLTFTPEDDGYQMHGIVTHVIDKSGRLRARFHGLEFKPANLLVFINALTNDTH